MRQFVEIPFVENDHEFTVTFDSLEDIDFVIERLEELRAELEHKIEMAKQKNERNANVQSCVESLRIKN